MKGNFLYQSEYSRFYNITDESLPPLDAITTKESSDRLIYQGGIAYTAWEMKKFGEFDQYLEANNLKLPPDFDFHEKVRFLHANKFNKKKAYHAVYAYLNWANTFLPVLINTELERAFDTKYIYIAGRDTKFRPIIHMNIPRISTALKQHISINALGYVGVFILEQVVHYMLLPGQIENWTLVVDLEKKSLSDLPLMASKTIIKMFQEAYRGRMAKCYVLNITNFTYVLWKIFKVFLDDSTREKIHLFKASYPDEVKAMIHPNQFLKKFGGQMEEPDKPWPPSITSNVFTYDSKQLYTEEQYQEALNNNPELVPRPDLINKFKGNRAKKLLPPKTFYFIERVEKRNQFNEIIQSTNQGNSPIKKPESPNNNKMNVRLNEEEEKNNLSPEAPLSPNIDCDIDINEESKTNCVNAFTFNQSENGKARAINTHTDAAINIEDNSNPQQSVYTSISPIIPNAAALPIPQIEEPHQHTPQQHSEARSTNTPTDNLQGANPTSNPSQVANTKQNVLNEKQIKIDIKAPESVNKPKKAKACKCAIF